MCPLNMTPFECYLNQNPLLAICFVFFYTWFLGRIAVAIGRSVFKPHTIEDTMTDAEKTHWNAYKRIAQQLSKETKEK